MRRPIFGCLALTICSLSLLTACNKQVDQSTVPTAVQAVSVASDVVEADATYTEVSNDVTGVSDTIALAQTEVGNDITAFDTTTSHCYTVTIDPVNPGIFPKTVTIDFGTGCLGKDGRMRKGKIITVFTGRLKVPGSQTTTTFDGFYVNDVHVEGTLVIVNTSTANVRSFTRTVTDGKLTKPSGNYISWNASHTITQTTGLGTPYYYWDDEFDITGSASGQTNRSGTLYTWSRTIDTPLHKKANCKWFDKGTVTVTLNTKTITLDFGDGTCDDQAQITYNGVSKAITLP